MPTGHLLSGEALCPGKRLGDVQVAHCKRCHYRDLGNRATGTMVTSGAKKQRAISTSRGAAALRTYDADLTAGLILAEAMDSAVVSKFEEIIEQCHGRVPPVLLRTLDAIHLATAAVSGESEIVATDTRLRQAALGLGFTVFPRLDMAQASN